MACVGGIRPGLLFVFDQRFGQQGARFLGLIRTDHHLLRAPDQDSEAELRAGSGVGDLDKLLARSWGSSGIAS